MLIAFHKPYGVLSQFSPDGSGNRTLADFDFPKKVYPIGRLDADSEGLLLLSDEKVLVDRMLHPRHQHPRRYWAQVEGDPTAASLLRLEMGVLIQKQRTRPAKAWRLDPQPNVAPREPPIRYRKNVPETWIALELIEGRNRQVRRMTACIGHPTLRLIRTRVGAFDLTPLAQGVWQILTKQQRQAVLSGGQ